MALSEPRALSPARTVLAAPALQAHDLQLVRPFVGWRGPVDDSAAVLHLRPLADATRTALCGARVVPVEVQAGRTEHVLCLDCAQERRLLRVGGAREPRAAGA